MHAVSDEGGCQGRMRDGAIMCGVGIQDQGRDICGAAHVEAACPGGGLRFLHIDAHNVFG